MLVCGLSGRGDCTNVSVYPAMSESVCIYIYVYIQTEREREGGREICCFMFVRVCIQTYCSHVDIRTCTCTYTCVDHQPGDIILCLRLGVRQGGGV